MEQYIYTIYSNNEDILASIILYTNDINDNIDIESTINTVNLLKYYSSVKFMFDNKRINEKLFYEYIEKIQYIDTWLKMTYEPKWRETLGDKFFGAVDKYIEHDLFLFCNSFDNTYAIKSNIDGDDTWIYKRKIDNSNIYGK